MIIIACSCGQGVIADDLEAAMPELTKHMTSGSYASGTGVTSPHVAYVGEADAKVSLTVATEALGAPDA